MVQAIEESGCPVITIPQETCQHAQTGRQEWMTVIKCVSVAGAKIIPYIILKGKNGVPGWLPQYLLAGWMFQPINPVVLEQGVQFGIRFTKWLWVQNI